MKNVETLAINKIVATTLIILMSTMSVFAFNAITVSAHNPPYQMPTWIYCVENPSPVGVGQPIIIFWWLDDILPTTNGQYGDRVSNVTVTLTLPDGTTQVWANQTGDPVGGSYVTYTPTKTGTYTVFAHYPGQTLANINPGPIANSYNTSPWIGDYYEPSTSVNDTFIVQTSPISVTPQAPLPTNHWNTPVNAMNYNWASVDGNWLSTVNVGASNPGPWNPTQGCINLYSMAPNTDHIVWTKPLDVGGNVGGTFGGLSYATGSAYESESNTPAITCIINGILYVNTYAPPRDGYYAIDLATGETLWYHNSTGPLLIGSQTAAHIGGTDIPWQYPLISFGETMNYATPNQAGVKAMLWSTYTYYSPTTSVATGVVGATQTGLQTYYPNETLAKDQISGTGVWQMIDPDTGNWICTLYNVPSGTMHTDPNGNILVYTINTATANGWLSMWNSTDAVNYPANNNYTTTPGEAFYWMWRPPVDQNINAAKYGYDWNVTLPAAVQGGTPYWVGDNVMLGTTSLTSNGAYGTNSYSVWALSLAPATRGQLLWEQSYPQPPVANATVTMGPVDPTNGVFTVRLKEPLEWYGYSLANW